MAEIEDEWPSPAKPTFWQDWAEVIILLGIFAVIGVLGLF